MGPVLLDVRALRKEFPGTLALDDVALEVRSGEVVGLLGHNGSGKSTLVKILSGLYAADGGEVRLGHEGRGAALHTIHQDLGLISTLTVVENLALTRASPLGGLLPVPAGERARVAELVAAFGGKFPVDLPVARLTTAQRTIVALARAFDGWGDGDNVLVLDEPTAALHGEEVGILQDAVRAVAARGAAVVYISHRLGEIVELADRVVVLRDGRVVARRARGEFDRRMLVDDIAGDGGRAVRRRQSAPRGQVRLTVHDLHGPSLRGVDLEASAGEIVGVAGLVGSGMEQLASVVFGAIPAVAGTVVVDGERMRLGSPRVALRAGVAFVPADRRRLAGIASFPARENITLPRLSDLRTWTGSVALARERADVKAWMRRVAVVPADADERRFDLFSGGNQQKIVLARCLRLDPAVLLLDEPTQGVDVGAQSEIFDLLAEFALHGATVVVSSSDIKELVAVSDRVVVLRDGRVVEEFHGDDLSEADIVRAVVDDHTLATHSASTEGRA